MKQCVVALIGNLAASHSDTSNEYSEDVFQLDTVNQEILWRILFQEEG